MNLKLPLLLCLFSFFAAGRPDIERVVAYGEQPEISMDTNDRVSMVFGRNDSIFYSTAASQGGFATPVYVAHVRGMHLGMTRGPQLASSAHYSIITAMDTEGNIHWFLMDQKTNKWISKGLVNDIRGSAPEGLMGLGCDGRDHFYAVWLDLRVNRHNNICFASLSADQGRWSPNKIIYQSPEGHVCECCKPNIAVRGSHVAVLFRNWLNGSRDLYLTESVNTGKTFARAEKLGEGTWKLNGCPMDGGGITITSDDHVVTTWQRKGAIYLCRPHEKEVAVDQGKACSITSLGSHLICSYQQGETLKVKDITSGKIETIGRGSFLKSVLLPDGSLLSTWQQDGRVLYQKG